MRNGALTAARGSLQETITYVAGLPTSIALAGFNYDNTAVAGATISAAYRPAGNLASYTAIQSGGKTLSTSIEQNGTGDLPRPSKIKTSLGISPIFDTGTYAYDGAGNITAIGSDVLKYDVRSRLISAKYSGRSTPCTDSGGNTLRSQCFGYDRWANLTEVTGVNARPLATSTSTNRLTSGTYDTRGNLKIFSTDTMTWDDINRMIREVRPGGIDWQYLYNGGDERTIRQTASSSGAAATRRDIARFITQAKIQAGQWTLTGTTCSEGALGFSDVHCTDPDWDYIQTFKEKNITAGCGSGQYCPNTALPREQMAVLLLRAEHGGGYLPPACSGFFTDVPCPSTYANWIERLAAEGITAGCGGGRFCPTQSVTELEMAVFLSKPNLWPDYHGIPGGSTYTLRDQENRLVTEFEDSFAARDNVFLGNLVVASYLAKQPGMSATPEWHFHASDHLGSVRLTVVGSDGATVETHKYWPYGDEVGTPPSSQRLAFAAMERDAEANHFYDHFRTHDFALGRFLNPDVIGGKPANPQTWNRYTYALSNPATLYDPDGRESQAAVMLDHDIRALASGQLTRNEYRARLAARAAGAGIGIALLTGPPAWRTLGRFLGTHPGLTLAALSAGSAVADAPTSARVVLGETMRRVGAAAKALDAGAFDAPWTTKAEVMARNMAWLRRAIDSGARIFDIGLDIARKAGSEFYVSEVALLQKEGLVRKLLGVLQMHGTETLLYEWVKK
jgi:RHS repeat-associated protein